VAETFADIVLATSLKWVCGTTGAGVLYMAPALICECRPFFRGWFSQEDPFSWALDRFTPAPDIRRFDSGTPGIVAAAASLPALDWHAKADRAAILAHNRRLAARIIAGAEALGLKLLSPRPSGERGGSVMIALPEARSAAEVVTALRARGLWADARGQILRLSPGVMTTEAGTEHLIEALGALLGRSG
jgi:selenocysteine lyase/cysteine desulfurase